MRDTITSHGYRFTLVSHELDADDATTAFATIERALDGAAVEQVAAWHAETDGRALDDIANRAVAEIVREWSNPDAASGAGVEIVAA